MYYWVVCKPQHAGNRPSEVSPLFLLSAHQLLVQWRPSPPHSELGLPTSIQYHDTRSNYHHHLFSFSFLMLYKRRNYGAKRMLLVGQKLSRPAETPPSTLADPSKGSLPPSSVLTTMIIVILALRRWDAPSNPSRCIKKSLSPLFPDEAGHQHRGIRNTRSSAAPHAHRADLFKRRTDKGEHWSILELLLKAQTGPMWNSAFTKDELNLKKNCGNYSFHSAGILLSVKVWMLLGPLP